MGVEGHCVYDPEDIRILRQVLDGAYNALRFALQHDPDLARAVRLELAEAIFHLARSGERRPRVMIERVLAELPPMRAQWAS